MDGVGVYLCGSPKIQPWHLARALGNKRQPVEQMSGAEAAECLGIPEETVKTRLHRARLRLQEIVVRSLDANCESAYDFHLSRCDRVVSRVLQRLALDPRADPGST